MFRKDSSPGPVYFIDPMLSRRGRDGTPSYSILGRQRDPSMKLNIKRQFVFLSFHRHIQDSISRYLLP